MRGNNHVTGGPVRVQGQDDGCCGVFFLKYILYIFNFILLLSGFGLAAVGVWTFWTTRDYFLLLGTQLDAFILSTYLLIGTGGAIILAFIIGCCATCNKNRACLMTYSVFLMVIFLAEVGAGILAYMYEVTLRTELSRTLHSSMKNGYRDNELVHQTLDNIQQSFRCCGVKTYEDWYKSDWSRTQQSNQTVPDSCCKTYIAGCGSNTGPSNINTLGCLSSLEDRLQLNLIIIGGVGLGLCCLQIFGIIFACCLVKKVRRWKVRENAYWE